MSHNLYFYRNMGCKITKYWCKTRYSFIICTNCVYTFWLFSAQPWKQILKSTLLMLRTPGLLHNLLISCHLSLPKLYSMNPLIILSQWQAPLLFIYSLTYLFLYWNRQKLSIQKFYFQAWIPFEAAIFPPFPYH